MDTEAIYTRDGKKRVITLEKYLDTKFQTYSSDERENLR